jgi:antitoxin component of MazEF toxin-antitoxin module
MTIEQTATVQEDGKLVIEIHSPELYIGAIVKVIVEEKTSRRKRNSVPLDDYLKRITPENMHEPIETGAAQGKEML